MAFDLRGLLDKSGVVIGLAEAARDGIVERINKDLEHQISQLNETLAKKDVVIFELTEKLRLRELYFKEAQDEVLKLQTERDSLKLDVAGLQRRLDKLESK